MQSTYYVSTPISELPPKNGYYNVVCCLPTELGVIHWHKDTGWQNGFYNDRVTHWLKPIDINSIIEEQVKEAWIKGCCQILKDISDTFLNEDNLRKSDRLSDRDIFQAVGETIRNFPIPLPPNQ